ncbi:DUF2264 domain-containing protein [Metabacillus halosaccharovorans]|uniref:DUF2264 domain-containing protein n=1 Tax=Metabacillus halosaccharovorans TaxID=930124 RepID=UPI00203D6D43|nr:DUF2264 domain-containing protein [Metabacillus halosaccharovorans]MCM3443654.1 DUF2264 domain-containing protein [Metabacillus halosaccharovorans]
MLTKVDSIKMNPLKTREDMACAIRQICEPLKPYYSNGFSRIQIGSTSAGYSDSISEIEGFSRLLWGLAPFYACGDLNYDIWEMHLQGIKNGTNPKHEEYWGDINHYDQRIVEMASFGLALILIPDKIWDPLNEQEKENLRKWLAQVNEYNAYDCNWLFFAVLVNLGFKNVGLPFDEKKIEENLEKIDEFHLSNGWYSDGKNGHSDYYVPFAIHYYGLIYAKVMEVEDPVRSQKYKEYAEEFAKDFIAWFSSNGSSIPYGRSLTYRFAQSSFWSAAVFAGINPFPLGVMKGIILRNLRWWFQKPIFNDAGILTIGYSYPNLLMAENYNSPGSPYWALKTFLPLALESEHPFWETEEEPLPEIGDKVIQKDPHLIICRNQNSEHVLAFNSGHLSTNEHTHTSAKYEKFVYSTLFGFSVPRAEWGLSQGAFDSMLALSEGDNIYRVKRYCEEFMVKDEYIYSKWKPWNDVEVKTWLIPGTPWHIRIHRIETGRILDTADGGFSLGIENKKMKSEPELETFQNDKESFAKIGWGASGIKSLYGGGNAELVYPNSNTNILHSRTVIPTIKTRVEPGVSWLVSAVFGELSNENNRWNEIPSIHVTNEHVVVQIPNKDEIIIKKNFDK